jgi:DNA primase
LNYLHEKRGLTDTTIETFGLGYAPHGYDNLIKHFSGKYMPQDLVDAGMLSERDSGGLFDRFRNRIMIPIRDEQGRMAGFGARIVDPDDIPKFLNSPETSIFTKGHLLYGLDRARKPIRAADQAVIVEGYLDVIALHQAGYENVVSPMGTALTEDQLRLLKRSTRRIVLALDPDVAGQKAVLRGLEAARSAMDKEGELAFDAHGLLRNEARLQADLRVATMPDDLDPDEIVARNKEEWAKLIENAKPIVTHVMETVSAGQNLNDPKVKNQIAAQILPLIDDLGNSMERDTYRQALARMLRVDERSLMAAQPTGPVLRRKPRVTEPSRRVDSPTVAVSNPRKNIEFYCLGILLRKPELIYRLDRKLEEYGLSPLALEDFEYTDHQMLFNVLRQAMGQDEKDHGQYVISQMPEALSALTNDLLTQTEKLDPLDDRLLEDILGRFLDLRRTHAMTNVNQLRFMQEDEQQQGGENLKMYQEQAIQFTRLLRGLDQAKLKLSKRQA